MGALLCWEMVRTGWETLPALILLSAARLIALRCVVRPAPPLRPAAGRASSFVAGAGPGLLLAV